MSTPPAAALPPELLREISREALNALPIRRYDGEVSVIAEARALDDAMADVRADEVVGFDTETRPSFRKGESHLPCLVQIATARRVYLVQLQRMNAGAALIEIIGAARIVKAGVALAEDLRQLKRLFALEEAAMLDLGHVARRHGLRQTGLRNLAAIFLGARIPKGNRTSNWAAPRLSAAQIAYAATDAWMCRELYFRFEQLGLLHDRNRAPDAPV